MIKEVKSGTIEKVLKHIDNGRVITPTSIRHNLKLGYYSVNSALDFLEKLGHIQIKTNGSTRFIEVKK